MQRKPRVGSRWRYTGIAGNEYDRVVESTGSGGEMLYRAFSEGVDLGLCSLSVDKFTDRCVPLDPDPWEPAEEATRDTATVAREAGKDAFLVAEASRLPRDPSGGQSVPANAMKSLRPKVRAGQVYAHIQYPGDWEPTYENSNGSGWRMRRKSDGCELNFTDGLRWTLLRDVEEPAWLPELREKLPACLASQADFCLAQRVIHDVCGHGSVWMEGDWGRSVSFVIQDCEFKDFEVIERELQARRPAAMQLECFFSAPREPAKMAAAVERHEAAIVERQPSPRCGQRRSDGRHEYAILDHERTDPGDLGRYLMRRDDGLRVAAGHHDVCGFAYVSGPTEPETPREALERTVKLEAEFPAAGETKGTWLRWLLGAIEAAQVRTANLCGRSAVDACSVRGWARGRRREFVANDELSLGPWQGAVAWVVGR